MVESFRTRRLKSEYPVIWVDALYENIREDIMASLDYCRSYLYELHGRALRVVRQSRQR